MTKELELFYKNLYNEYISTLTREENKDEEKSNDDCLFMKDVNIIKTLLPKCQFEFTADQESIVTATLIPLLNEIPHDYIDENDFLNLMSNYSTPAYYYGQRLRRYCGRGALDKVTELVIRGCDVMCCDGEG